jgi:hypothetical protein
VKGWSAPRIATRTGASHLRRRLSCQDASGWIGLPGTGTEPLWAMVVADGHGGARYRHSRTGSALACRVALDLIAVHLATWESGPGVDLDPVWHALHHTLPDQIVSLWRRETGHHWHKQPCASGESFTPVLYGSTLGVVLLTPHWWASTGLGDWDLVRIDADGQARLLSEEGEVGGPSEATCSLCLTNAPACFRARTQVHRLRSGEPSFSLLLSTDGIRKSCSTDRDFFTLARYLAESEASAAEQLAADLDRISGQGSGDDVSVAIARWHDRPEGHGALPPPLWPACRIEQPAPLQR